MIVLVGNKVHKLKTKSSPFTTVKMRDDNATPTYTVALQPNDPEAGHCIGSGMYQKGSSANIEAISNPGYIFKQWSDGSTDAQREIIVNGSISLIAYFEIDQTRGILTYHPNQTYFDLSMLQTNI